MKNELQPMRARESLCPVGVPIPQRLAPLADLLLGNAGEGFGVGFG